MSIRRRTMRPTSAPDAMPIRYSLRRNPLTPDPADRYARVETVRSVGLDEVADRIAAAGSTLSRVDALAALESLQTVVQDLLAEGANVNLPFVQLGARVKGTFDGDGDRFDAARHAVLPTARPGYALRQFFRAGVPVEKTAAARPAPAVLHVADLNTGQRDGPLTPGGMAEITGSRLAFDPASPDQGVFFVAGDGAATRAGVVGHNAPSRLLVLVPGGLAAGAYRVEVRAAFGRELRTGRFDGPLSVSPSSGS